MWQMRCVLSLLYLLAATAFVLTAGSSSCDGPLQAAFLGQPESPTPRFGSRVELAPETKFHPPPHFQQRKWFAATLAQHPPQKWCDLLQSIFAYLM
jgi:hypothetical protein